MIDIKCPFCQQELREIYCYNVVMGYLCPNPDCKKAEKLKGNAEFWQELIRTRKALDVAKDTIRHADWFFDGDYNVDAKTMHNEIKYAIKAITALEQKDVK